VTRDELRDLVRGLKFSCGLAAMKPEVAVHDEVSPWDGAARGHHHIVGHLALKLWVPDRVSGGTVAIHGPCREVTVDDTPASVLKKIREELLTFLTHELDEGILLHDVRIFDPHKSTHVEPDSLLEYALKRGEEKRRQLASYVSTGHDLGRLPTMSRPGMVFVDELRGITEPARRAIDVLLAEELSPGAQALRDIERVQAFEAARRAMLAPVLLKFPDRNAFVDIVETFMRDTEPPAPAEKAKASPGRPGHVPEQLRANLARDLGPLDRQRFLKSARKR
jgi:hypothetical protein